jgi:hypothetical protein
MSDIEFEYDYEQYFSYFTDAVPADAIQTKHVVDAKYCVWFHPAIGYFVMRWSSSRNKWVREHQEMKNGRYSNLADVHIWNERNVTDDGRLWYFCKCKTWLPEPLLGYVETFVGNMRCREYLCLECCKKRANEGIHIQWPLMSRKDYLKNVMGWK